jgi:hypothetical protein
VVYSRRTLLLRINRNRVIEKRKIVQKSRYYQKEKITE